MPLVRNTTAFAAAVTTVLLLAQPMAAADNESELKRVAKATESLNALVQTPDDRIPEHILQRAEAIVVIPNLVKGAFIVGGEHGKGIMSIRDAKTGGWSLPSFVHMTGGSVGWQIGGESIDLVLLVMNKEGVDDLLKSEFKLGGEGLCDCRCLRKRRPCPRRVAACLIQLSQFGQKLPLFPRHPDFLGQGVGFFQLRNRLFSPAIPLRQQRHRTQVR